MRIFNIKATELTLLFGRYSLVFGNVILTITGEIVNEKIIFAMV